MDILDKTDLRGEQLIDGNRDCDCCNEFGKCSVINVVTGERTFRICRNKDCFRYESKLNIHGLKEE